MNIAIVGLGAAGMRAAMLLSRQGHTLQLFDARLRLGGRMETSDQGEGAVYESGGEWIDGDHERCLALLAELGLEPETPPAYPRHYMCHGERCTEENLWQDALVDELRFEAAARELCRDLRQPVWANKPLHHLDLATLATFIDQHAQSPRGRWLLTSKALSDEGTDPDQIGLLGWLGFLLYYLQRQGNEMSAYRIPGGAAELFRRMASTVQVEPRLGIELTRLTQSDQEVNLEFADGSMAQAERVVLAIPPRPLERIVFEPALSVEKRCAIEACRMSPMVKVCLEFDKRWWLDFGWGGSLQCDFPIQQTWDGGRGESAILTCYICGRAANALISDPDPVRRTLDSLGEVHPEAVGHFRRGWLHNWIGDPYAGGGFSHLPPGYVLQHMEHIAPPEDRIHFVGEHTATWTGFIEGALESAERVVAEIESAA